MLEEELRSIRATLHEIYRISEERLRLYRNGEASIGDGATMRKLEAQEADLWRRHREALAGLRRFRQGDTIINQIKGNLWPGDYDPWLGGE